jgi:hypothetical protein
VHYTAKLMPEALGESPINVSYVEIVVWSAVSLYLILWTSASPKANGAQKSKAKVNVFKMKW